MMIYGGMEKLEAEQHLKEVFYQMKEVIVKNM
jgi:hypothetical protein